MKTPIPGYPGYFACPTGVIYGKKGKPLKGHIDGGGYLQHIFLVDRGLKKKSKVMRRAHRIIALTFIPNPLNKRTINHKDGNKLNNHINNLEWATYSEQLKHSYNQLNREKKPCIWRGKTGKDAAWCKDVSLMRGEKEILRGSQQEIADYLGYSNTYIGNIIKNKTILSGNYTIIENL